jgi:hypothetical protein
MATMHSLHQAVPSQKYSTASEDDDESFGSYSDAIITSLLTQLCVCIGDDNEGEAQTEQRNVEFILLELYKCCNPFLNRMCSQDCQSALINENGHSDIVTAMIQYVKRSITVQQVGCRLLTASICGLPTDLKQVVITSNNNAVLKVVLDAMQEYPYDILVQSTACQFIANIVDVLQKEGTKERFDVSIAAVSNYVLFSVDSFDDIMLLNMQRFQLSLEMQWVCCLYFLNLSSVLKKQITKTRREKLFAVGKKLTEVMKRFPNSKTLLTCCYATLQNIKMIT